MALRPPCRMGPPLRSSAADAHYCIMVQIPRIYRIQVCGAMLRAQLASAPQIVPNTETQHHTREQSELPRLTLDGKIPIQVLNPLHDVAVVLKRELVFVLLLECAGVWGERGGRYKHGTV